MGDSYRYCGCGCFVEYFEIRHKYRLNSPEGNKMSKHAHYDNDLLCFLTLLSCCLKKRTKFPIKLDQNRMLFEGEIQRRDSTWRKAQSRQVKVITI